MSVYIPVYKKLPPFFVLHLVLLALTLRSFPYSWLITVCVTRVKRRVPHV